MYERNVNKQCTRWKELYQNSHSLQEVKVGFKTLLSPSLSPFPLFSSGPREKRTSAGEEKWSVLCGQPTEVSSLKCVSLRLSKSPPLARAALCFTWFLRPVIWDGFDLLLSSFQCDMPKHTLKLHFKNVGNLRTQTALKIHYISGSYYLSLFDMRLALGWTVCVFVGLHTGLYHTVIQSCTVVMSICCYDGSHQQRL